MDFDNSVYQQDLDSAVRNSKKAGRFELSDYLDLRASNDAIREKARDWLFETVREIVFAFNDHRAGIKIEHLHKQKLKYGSSYISGDKLELRQGIRCLSFEVGWTRSFSDGYMKGGALAYCRISHFGFSKEGEELELLKFEGKPQWFSVDDEKKRTSFNVLSLKRHFEVFLK